MESLHLSADDYVRLHGLSVQGHVKEKLQRRREAITYYKECLELDICPWCTVSMERERIRMQGYKMICPTCKKEYGDVENVWLGADDDS